jgi:hypothetical protein
MRKYLEKIHGVDVMDIFGISEISALEILWLGGYFRRMRAKGGQK